MRSLFFWFFSFLVIVEERTRELSEKVDELEKYHALFVGREFRIKELRDEMKVIKIKTDSKLNKKLLNSHYFLQKLW